MLLAHSLGYPRIGANRELKSSLEAYWAGKIPFQEVERVARDLRRARWLAQRSAGVDLIPSNDFSLYDHVLDTTCLVGNIPARFVSKNRENTVDPDTLFAVARGVSGSVSTAASEMTKWFDTNYHYIVPEFDPSTKFTLSTSKPFDEFQEALQLGIKTKPVLMGPYTYLTVGKAGSEAPPGFDRFSLLESLVSVYVQVLQKLAELGAEWVQMDEPVFSLDLDARQRASIHEVYARLAAASPKIKLLVVNYFGDLAENRTDFLSLPVAAVHFDLVRAPHELDAVLRELPSSKILSLGLVDGRNIWRTDLPATYALLEKAVAAIGTSRVMVAPSCSLLHVPFSLKGETKLDPAIKSWLAFAEEKLGEVVALRDGPVKAANDFAASREARAARRDSPLVHREAVRHQIKLLTEKDFHRISTFPVRQAAQRARLALPALPTTTIGSFPQTQEVRAARAQWKSGALNDAHYEEFLEAEIEKAVRLQEELGLDVLVHGEFERNDMVEYFGEQLEGYVFTRNGWVQSYGSRCVKPPIVYGDVARPKPMTVRWSSYAQSLTRRPMKGMLSGPVTMLQWSFVRDDQPRKDTALQIALALRGEVRDLADAGIAAIQIDEPALREGLPLRRREWEAYLNWAVDAFRLTAACVGDATQIHTHMCYAEFNDIIEAIARMDADVITIETSRSNMELLKAFATFKYPNEIGPGVWDIHSPRVPSMEEMNLLMTKAISVLPVRNLWVNPDCGLKTRGWKETKEALVHMVNCAKTLRKGAVVAAGPY